MPAVDSVLGLDWRRSAASRSMITVFAALHLITPGTARDEPARLREIGR